MRDGSALDTKSRQELRRGLLESRVSLSSFASIRNQILAKARRCENRADRPRAKDREELERAALYCRNLAAQITEALPVDMRGKRP